MLPSFLCGEFLLHNPSWLKFYLGSFSYTSCPGFFSLFFNLGSFSNTPRPGFIYFFIWGVSLTHRVLASFFCGEFLLHIPCWLVFIWGVSLPSWLYFYLGRFSYTSRSCFIFLWGVSLTHPMLVSFLFSSGEFLFHIPCWLHFYLGSFFYTSGAGFFFSLGSFTYTSRAVLIFIWGASLTHPMLALFFRAEFLLQPQAGFFSSSFFFFILGSFS